MRYSIIWGPCKIWYSERGAYRDIEGPKERAKDHGSRKSMRIRIWYRVRGIEYVVMRIRSSRARCLPSQNLDGVFS